MLRIDENKTSIEITIKRKIARQTNKTEYICGNNDFVINFIFDDEWAEFVTKTARFIYNGTHKDVVFQGNQCAVPIISDTYNINVGVFAGDLRTTTAALVSAKKSILCGSNPPAEPAPDVYSQMVELFNAGLDESRLNADAAKASEQMATQSVTEAAQIKADTQILKETAEKSAEAARNSENASSNYKKGAETAYEATVAQRNAAAQFAQSAEQNSSSASKASLKAEGHEANAKASEDASALSAMNAKKSEDICKQAMANLLIVGSASGKVANTDDAAHMTLLDLKVNDGTEVQTVKAIGKNFLHRDYATSVSNIGVTVEWDAENQEFIFDGKTTAGGDIMIVNPLQLDWVPGEKYTVSVRKVSGTATLATGTNATTYAWSVFQDNASKFIRGSTAYSEFRDVYNFTATAFALDEKRHYVFYFQCWRPGTVFDNYRVRIQIEQGTTMTDWEAYQEESVAVADTQSLMLQKGYNNIFSVPSADITVDYVVDTKMYIDKKIAEVKGV